MKRPERDKVVREEIHRLPPFRQQLPHLHERGALGTVKKPLAVFDFKRVFAHRNSFRGQKRRRIDFAFVPGEAEDGDVADLSAHAVGNEFRQRAAAPETDVADSALALRRVIGDGHERNSLFAEALLHGGRAVQDNCESGTHRKRRLQIFERMIAAPDSNLFHTVAFA